MELEFTHPEISPNCFTALPTYHGLILAEMLQKALTTNISDHFRSFSSSSLNMYFFGVRAFALSKCSFRPAFPRPEWRKIAQVPTHQRAPGGWDESKLGWETWLFSWSGWRKFFVDSLKVRLFCHKFLSVLDPDFAPKFSGTYQANCDLG